MRRPAALGIATLLLLGAAWLAWEREVRRPVRAADAPAQPLEIRYGAGVGEIGEQLHALGLVRHPLLFRILVAQRGAGERLKAGEYLLEGPISLDGILTKLVQGDVVRYEITFPEGRTLEEMATIAEMRRLGLARAAFLAAARDASAIRDLDPDAEDLEGYLFPDTYEVPRGVEPSAALVRRMVGRFREVVSPELERIRQRGLTVRELVTLASLVELETAVPAERPRIAAVFLNRLEKGMPLQTDPTIIFALRRAGRWDGNIRRGDLDIESPYNTYRYAGLPPGPIASPGREAIRAVLEPAPGGDLYFVSRNDGSHHFSLTLTEHERAVDFYQRHHGRPPDGGGG